MKKKNLKVKGAEIFSNSKSTHLIEIGSNTWFLIPGQQSFFLLQQNSSNGFELYSNRKLGFNQEIDFPYSTEYGNAHNLVWIS
ncbi:hypothetical protein [Algoriphagus limi]|uniref:Uncharacterized protein n=1 Tax=Algoriphagus limi TaxID=2975273 RepID=A0ABT2G7F0_9BACT|nr:hypothetical protein [Algoriphagus limi]MCS5491193.1 hypothetical protein [Algoriphagus limi]